MSTAADTKAEHWGTGRRKTAVARVRVRDGSGSITINGRTLEEFFPNDQDRNRVLSPLVEGNVRDRIDVIVNVNGGGITGQSGAIMLGLARALIKHDSATEDALRHAHLLTRDSRMKERKKYGLHGARRGTQFSKR